MKQRWSSSTGLSVISCSFLTFESDDSEIHVTDTDGKRKTYAVDAGFVDHGFRQGEALELTLRVEGDVHVVLAGRSDRFQLSSCDRANALEDIWSATFDRLSK